MTILDFAKSLPDHRQQVKVQHKATDIVFITVAAVICGAQDWDDVAYLANVKKISFENIWNFRMEYHLMTLLIASFQIWIRNQWNQSFANG